MLGAGSGAGASVAGLDDSGVGCDASGAAVVSGGIG